MTTIQTNPQAMTLLSRFFDILSMPDEEQRLRELATIVHPSLLASSRGTDAALRLSRDIIDYSYKKAYAAYTQYALPVVVTQVREGNMTTIGFGETAKRGTTHRYFVAKKESYPGMPAPIHIFFPEDGSDPSLLNFGSL